MSKRVFKSVYEFYELPEEERIALIGEWFTEEGRKQLFFPVQLALGEFNYGKRQGLLYVLPISRHHKGGQWFSVGVCSPDDLDLTLEFRTPETAIRQDVIEYIQRMNKRNVTYKGLLGEIHEHFKAGDLYL